MSVDYFEYCWDDFGLEVRIGRLEDFDFFVEWFDFICFSYVFEYLL